ncbi:hypothetical protein [Soonwooa sp.]|uniref:XAC2610-related protein n=1 Tax=Soonwooa sp. TaxID=1938592 RepID=UPI00260C5879|nr:hypothetical protein [Soonwooa sp.]
MKKTAFLPVLVLGQFCFGQYNFNLKNASNDFDAKISVQNCEGDTCSGEGTIKLIDKKTKKIFQTLTSEDLYFYLNKNQKPSVNVIEMYGEQSPLIFGDFNFDGSEDVAVRNGNQGSYGGPSYDVYVYNSTKKQYVLSEELTDLTYENLGMFETDSSKKRITTYAKSGCCWHIKTEYEVVPKKGLVKVSEFEEDATGGENVKVITRNLVKGKWQTKTKTYKIKDYYKE